MKLTKLANNDTTTSENLAIPTEATGERKVNIVAIANLEEEPAYRLRELTSITIKYQSAVIRFCSRDPVDAVCAILRSIGGKLR